MKNKMYIKIFRDIAPAAIGHGPCCINLGRINIKLPIKRLCMTFILLFSSTCHANVYTDTVQQIKNIYSKSNTHTHEEFLKLDIIKSNLKLEKFLKEISENDQGILSKVTGYYHPIGFIKIVVYKSSNGEQLRLHFWGQGGAKAIHQDFNNGWEPIHNHRWNFSSKVIKGRLSMKEYTDFDPRIRFNDIKEAQTELMKLDKTYTIYDVSIVQTRKSSTDYNVIKTGKFAIIGNSVDKYVTSGNAYWLSHTTPHKVKSEKNTSTILLMDPPSKLLASEIFPYNDEENFQDSMELQNLTHKEIQVYIKEFLDDLKGDIL